MIHQIAELHVFERERERERERGDFQATEILKLTMLENICGEATSKWSRITVSRVLFTVRCEVGPRRGVGYDVGSYQSQFVNLYEIR